MSDPGAISRERFIELLDAYGAEPERWPEAERAAAQALLARDPELQRLHAQALALDQLLDAQAPLEPSAALRRAVAEIPLRVERGAAQLPWLLASALRSALAAAFVLGLGVLAGSSASADALLSGTAVEATQSDAAQSSASDQGQTAVPAGTDQVALAAGQADDPLDSLFELAFSTGAAEEQAP